MKNYYDDWPNRLLLGFILALILMAIAWLSGV